MPQIDIPYGLNVLTTDPIDGRALKATLAERDAIPATSRHNLMYCSVIGENKTYQLVGGITNSNWIEVGDNITPNNWKWSTHFNDAIGFNFSNALRPDAATGTITGNPLGVAWNRIETTTPYTAIIRRDTANGVNYPMHSGSSKFVFNMLCNFEVLPTAAANYRAGWSFSNTTGPISDTRFSVILTHNGSNLTWTLTVAETSLLFTQVNVAATTINANSWYKFSIEIDRANSIYRFLINNSLVYQFSPSNNIYNIPLDWYGFAMYSETSTTRTTATRFLIDYYEEKITANSPITW